MKKAYGDIDALAESHAVADLNLKSNWGVVKVILNPQSAKPQMVSVARAKTVAGLVTHANFITLTPGTVSSMSMKRKCDFGAWLD